jgi:pyruvate,water dikinase
MVAKLGERGVKVPPGFATTADAYWRYIEANDLKARIPAYAGMNGVWGKR